MRLYTYTSDQFREMSDWNCQSAIAQGFEVYRRELGNLDTDCDNKGDGWMKLLRAKVEMILDITHDCDEGTFVFADSDVRWYQPADPTFLSAAWDIGSCLGDADIAFQCDWWGTGVKCQGLFVARSTPQVNAFFSDIRDCISLEHSDQDATNEILSRPYDLQYQLLPYRYWTQGASTGVRWKPGDPVNPPSDIIAHHANWTVGAEHKMALLRAVEEKVNAH